MDSPYERFGGTLSKEALEHTGLTDLRLGFRTRVRAKPDGPLAPNEVPNGDIDCEIVDDANFNAVAFIDRRREHIGINLGVLNLFNLYSVLFMSDSVSFKGMGIVETDETERTRALLTEVDIFRLYHDANLPIPQDRTRAAFRTQLNLLAYIHLLHHEQGHIVKCHIPYLYGAQQELQVLAEIPAAPLSKEECRIRRALELDADHGAFATTFLHLEGVMKSGLYPEVTSDNYIEMWAASMTLLYRIMGREAEKVSGDTANSTHPSAEARLLHGMSAATGALQNFQGIELPMDRVVAGMGNVMLWWDKHGLPGRKSTKMLDDARDELSDLKRDVTEMTPDLVELQMARKARILSEATSKQT